MTAMAAPGADPPADAGPALDTRPSANVRRSSDALRLSASAIVLLAAVLLAAVTRSFARNAQHGLITAVSAMPTGLRDVVIGVVQLTAVLAPVAAAALTVARRRRDALTRVVPAALLGALLAWALVQLALKHGHPDEWPGVLTGHKALVQAGWPSAVYLAGCAGAAVAAGPWLERRWRRAVWWLVVSCAVLSAATAAVVPLDAVAALAIGGVAGSVVLLFGGAPPDRPDAEAVAAALIACGIPVTALHERPAADQRVGEGVRYLADTADQQYSVRVLGLEDRNRDLFHRLARWLLLSEPGDLAEQPLAAVEHELLMLVAADRAGARVVAPVIAFPVAGGGALLVTDDDSAMRALSDGESGPREPSGGDSSSPAGSTSRMNEAALTDTWRSVAILQQHRIAHRSLIPSHILVAPDGGTRLTSFTRGRLDASPVQLGTDLAVLLALTAVDLGVERAVACARAGLGPERLATALPYLQPLALIGGPGRRAVAEYDHATAHAARKASQHRMLSPGGGPNILHELIEAVHEACDVEVPKKAKLARLTWKKAAALAGAFLVLHLILPQLANAGGAWQALKQANWWWLLLALPAALSSQVCSALLQEGTIPERLPFRPNVLVQFAASFLNRITPNNVGGMALNLRFLQKAGVDTGAATASVGLQSLAGAASSAVAAAVFFAWTGQRHSGVHLGAPTGHWLLPVLVAVIVAGCLLGFTQPGRRFLREKVWHFLKAAGDTVAKVATRPSKIAEGVLGALGLPLVQIISLDACLHALGVHLPVSQVGAVYITSRVVASATPTPGGLGALEAALIAGLTALGAPAGPVTSAVLLYRLLSFWLNIPVGGLALHVVQRRKYV